MDTNANKKQISQLVNDLKKINDEARQYLCEVDQKIAALDIKYAKTLVQFDTKALKLARKIKLEEK